MRWMVWAALLVGCSISQLGRAGVFEVRVTTKEKPVIGHLTDMRLEITNISDQPVSILEIRPSQPCEEPINLIRSLYGRIDYDEEADEYIYDPQQQSATMIPVAEGFLLPGKMLWLNLKYRPFADQEDILIQYAAVGNQKIYARVREENSLTRFTTQGTDLSQVILSRLTELDRQEEKAQIAFQGISGERSKLCYCETLKTYVDFLPSSLCKEWDSGDTAKFRVGEKQEGMG